MVEIAGRNWAATVMATVMAAAVAIPSVEGGYASLPREKDGDTSSSMAHALLMPGTNFCGRGWRAESLDHLGSFGVADKCCRQHDLGCPDSIPPLTSKHGLYNWRMYTAMHCSCDDRFRSCLRLARSPSADTVG